MALPILFFIISFVQSFVQSLSQTQVTMLPKCTRPTAFHSLFMCLVSLYASLVLKPVSVFFFPGLHHYECVAPLVANSLQSGRFGPGRLLRSMTARGSRGRSAPSSSMSSAVVPVASSNTQKARKSRSALRLHCHPFGRYAWIGLDAVPG